ncbi:uncharacterized protein LOC135844408 [Planococcus citri]|uniref:uncharacterized protein LOC135844408 n=1 Tax=Planococcus citri TaxID=170843 RepID=UPI0031F98E26
MHLSFFVICAFSFFVKADNEDIPPVEVIQDPWGADVFCLFTYSRWAKSSNINQMFPSAKRVGVARLPYHRLDFNYYSEEVKGSLPTTVPDCGYEVWGAIYYIPVQDYDLVATKGGRLNNKRIFQFVQNPVEAYLDGNIDTFVNLKCNSFQQLVLPEKSIYGLPLPENRRPSKLVLDGMLDAFIDAGLPEKYIEEVSWLPIRS